MPGIVEQRAEAEFQVEAAGDLIKGVDLNGPNTDLLGNQQ